MYICIVHGRASDPHPPSKKKLMRLSRNIIYYLLRLNLNII